MSLSKNSPQFRIEWIDSPPPSILRYSTPKQVRANGYEWTRSTEADVWLFPSRKKAEAKARILAKHYCAEGWQFRVDIHPESFLAFMTPLLLEA